MQRRERLRGSSRTRTPTRRMSAGGVADLGVRRGRQHLLRAVAGVVMLALMVAGVCIWLLRGQMSGRYASDAYYATLPECFAAPRVPGDRRRDKSHLKVANFNAEWLFMYGGRGGIRCPAESCPWTSTVEALNHMRQVAELLATIDADVVHLSEVEDCRVLKNLLDLIPGNHGYKPYLVLGKDHATGQSVALLTRVDPHADMIRTDKRAQYPVEGTACKSRLRPGSAGITKHYAVPITVEDGAGKRIPFVFAGLHLLARPSDNVRCTQREAQATVLRDLIRSMSRDGERVIVMGDYNDFDEAAVGIDGRLPITSVLRILYGSSGSGRPLRNAASLVPTPKRYSCWFDVNQNCRLDGREEKVMIDHILMDTELDVVEAIIHHDYEPTCDARVSDHWPFSVKIRL